MGRKEKKTILIEVTLENKTTSEWLKFRPTSQNALPLIDSKYWSMERVTLGITAQSSSKVHINNRVYDLNVGSGHPNGVTAINGLFVQWLKSYVIWVQTGVIPVGFYLLYICLSMKGWEK